MNLHAKKKIIALCLAVVLAVCVVPGAFAGGLAGVVSAWRPANHVDSFSFNVGTTLHIPLGASSFQSTGGAFNVNEITQEQLGRLQVFTNKAQGSPDFGALFTYNFTINRETTPAQPYLQLNITPKEVDADTPFSYTVGLLSVNANGTIHSYTQSDSLFRFNGVVRPAASAITGFAPTGSAAVTPVTIQAGASELFSLPSELFTYSGGTDKTITPAKVAAYGLAARSANGAFTARLVNNNGRAMVEVTVPAGTAAGVYTGAIEIYSAANLLAGKATLATLQVTVPGQGIAGNKVTGIDPAARLGYDVGGIWSRAAKNGKALPTSGETLDNLSVTGGDEVTLEFNSDFFLWEKGKPLPAEWLTTGQIRNGRVAVKMLSGYNSNVVDSVDIRYDSGRAYVRIKFIERFVSTKDRDFRFSVALTVDGRVERDTEALVEGTMANEYIEVYRDTDYVDLSYGDIAEAMESISRIEVDLGNGVSIFTRMVGGKLYYGAATTDMDNRDYELMERYPEIDMVYTLSTVGLNSTGNTVKIDLPGRYYVYDRNLNYIGTTAERLSYSTKYYITTRQIDFPVEEADEDDPDDYQEVDEPAPPTPGGTSSEYEPKVPMGATPGNVTPPTNQYHNPVNGR